ncbi:MAG: YabP/YqfC family sporulation protein [Clostridia bacterium]|nr:YabP/YqfC family sporulation protein [Clostridium sp.]MBS6252640.1 YabP/YqfC family sporulation protein [Clostridium sp.]
MKKRYENRASRLNKIDKMLDLPKEIYSNTPKISILGFDEMVIENYKGILEYEEFFVRISTYIGIVNINGYNLKLENMTDDDIKVTGKIESFELERTID